jgi:hypothetical protein
LLFNGLGLGFIGLWTRSFVLFEKRLSSRSLERLVALNSLLWHALFNDILRKVLARSQIAFVPYLLLKFLKPWFERPKITRVVVQDRLLAKGRDVVVFEVVSRTRSWFFFA